MRAIRERIERGVLPPGERLPSVRRFAALCGLSPSTVVEAYDRLSALGLIQSRPGSGFFVTRAATPPGPAGSERRERVVDPFWVSRQSLDMDETALKPGCGWLPSDWMPHAAIRQALREASRASDTALVDYAPSRGARDLRELLSRQFAAEGLPVPPDRILLTQSASSAMDLVCRLLLRVGDTVLVDDPCYFNFRALLAAQPVRVVGVSYTETGPDAENFAAIVAEHRPRLYLTNAALHNPTGATLSPAIAHRLLRVAAEHGLTIVEDEVFAAFEPEPSVRMASLDGLERVIRVGSFSKTLSASLRCGYVAGTAALIEALADLQVATSFTGPGPLATGAVRSVLLGGSYRKHLDQVRHRLSRARRDAAERLAPLGIVPWLMPRGGYSLWCRLPDGVDSTQLARKALERNMLLAPGAVFSVSGGASSFMRVNVTQMPYPAAYEVLARAIEDTRRPS